MLWNVWVVDLEERSFDVVLESVSKDDAAEFENFFADDESLIVVVIPSGFFLSRFDCGVNSCLEPF
jgi:hypothetical protein